MICFMGSSVGSFHFFFFFFFFFSFVPLLFLFFSLVFSPVPHSACIVNVLVDILV